MNRQRISRIVTWTNENQGWLTFIALIITVIIAFIDVSGWSLFAIVAILIIFIGIPIVLRSSPNKVPALAPSNEKSPPTTTTNVNDQHNLHAPTMKKGTQPKTVTPHLPREILAEIEEAPAYSQPALKKAYIGLPVEWDVTFSTLFTNEKDSTVDLMMLDRGNYPWVYAIVDIEDYPQLKLLKKGAQLRVTGVIKDFGGGGIRLRDGKIFFL